MSLYYTTDKSRARAAEALRLRRTGLTFREVGERLTVTRTQAARLCALGEHLEQQAAQRVAAAAGPAVPPETSIQAMDITVRSENLLWSAGARTVADLLALSEDDVKGLPGASSRTVDDVRQAALALGFVWPAVKP